MKLSTVLFSSAALLATGVVAQAADLPSKKAAPVEYVRVCSTYGAGFFYIPGTDTCIRIGGRARYEFQYSEPFARGDNTTGSRATGRIYLDARTATEYGLLRAYVRYDVARRIGTIQSGTAARIGTAFNGTGTDFGIAQTQVDLNRAFVQFGGLTAGRTQSFFDFYAGDLEYVGTTAGSSVTTNVLAYTASFGGGFSATLSMEDPVERRNVITGNPYAGSGTPDVVANLRLDQAWGTAQLSAALHEVRPSIPTASIEYGYAVNAGVKVNLPMLAAGDALYLQGTYTKGAATYVISNPFGYGKAGTFGIGNVGRLYTPDAVATGVGGSNLDLTTVWGLTAAVQHYWTPTIRQALFGSYVKTDYSNAAYLSQGGNVGANGYRDWSYWTVGTNVTWSPVKDLDIGVEVNYLKANASGAGVTSTVTGAVPGILYKSDSQITTRLKIVRDF
ncbi:porin [Alsobacter soli]|uniref:Porin n=1 Tax=Alsobacter soli TaxID=2109933 RepID=A0A2T1HM57_9HYPH|nr:porin [Alsobacter soli]PSC02740.1 porin [Alsobacter soli]